MFSQTIFYLQIIIKNFLYPKNKTIVPFLNIDIYKN